MAWIVAGVAVGVAAIFAIIAIIFIVFHPSSREAINGIVSVISALATIIALIVAIIALVVAIWGNGVLCIPSCPTPSPTPSPSPSCSNGICVNQAKDGQFIGITDGHDDFSDWNTGDIGRVKNLIYRENQGITNKPHMTLVVATTPSDADDDLQGAYVFQREAAARNNCPLPHKNSGGCLRVRLLIANTGKDSADAMIVAQQILLVKQTDPTFAGVMGWPDSTSDAKYAIQYLGRNSVLMVSPSASSDAFTGISPFFFRVAPLDSAQGSLAAHYVQSNLQANTVAIFYSPNLPYSVTLESNFKEQFDKPGKRVIPESFPRGDDLDKRSVAIKNNLGDALKSSPDLIYCACYSDDLNSLINDVRTSNEPNLQIMAGDAAYQPENFIGSNYRNLFFTSFAFPDEWGASIPDPCTSNGYSSLPAALHAKQFYCNYANDFDPSPRRHLDKPYGYDRADSDAILSYDATTVLAWGYVRADEKEEDVQKVLLGSGANSCSGFQGVSGAISFGLDGNPVQKVILLLSVDGDHNTHQEGISRGNAYQEGISQIVLQATDLQNLCNPIDNP